MEDKSTLERHLNNLRKKCDELAQFVQCYKENENSTVEIQIKTKNCNLLQKKLEKLKIELYELPGTSDITQEEEAIDLLEEKLETTELKLKIILEKITAKPNESFKSNIKLPKIPLPRFDGKYEEWSSFESQFVNLIVNNQELTDNEKLYYLRSSLVGETKQIETEEDNFESLFKALKERYENRKLIVNAHVTALINFEKIHGASAKGLRHFLDTIRKNLRALKVLKFQRNKLSDIILLNILLPKLDRESRKLFESSLQTTDVPDFDNFLDFLEKRSFVLESVSDQKIATLQPRRSFLTSSNALTPKEGGNCYLCPGRHHLSKCNTFLQLDVDARYERIRRNKLCLLCLGGKHLAAACRARDCCAVCRGRHNTLLHRPSLPGRREKASDNEPRSKTTPKEDPPDEVLCSSAFKKNDMDTGKKGNLLLTANVYIEGYDGKKRKMRAIIDCGSEVNLVTTECANILKLRREKANVPVTGINGTVRTITSKIVATISNAESSYNEDIEFLVVPKIVDRTPSKTLDVSKLDLPTNIKLADVDFNKPGKIQLLLGIERFFQILKCNKIVLNDSLTLQDTVFGYVISGKLASSQQLNRCFLASELSNLEESVEKFWKLESVEETSNRKSEDEFFCENHFLSTYKRDSSGRYIVDVPLKNDPKILGESKEFAWRRLNSLWNRLSRNPELCKLYRQFMKEYQEMGHMEEVKEECEPEISYYIPHQGIHRPDKSTTKLRVVFDASAPSSNGISLNSLQINGGVVQEDLFSILCRFRKHRIALTADIKKMYRMILVNPQQRDLQRILWKDSPDDPVKTYKLNTVTYGTTSAPYLATRTLKQIAIDEGGNFPLAAPVVDTDFYVDDLVTGVNEEEAAVELQKQLINLLDAGGMKLHKWSSNIRRLLRDVPQEDLEFSFDQDKENIKTLGLKWNPKNDTFGFNVTTSVTTSISTKRTVLSEISRLFDPLGLLGPVIVIAKIFLQRLWLLRIDWDQPLPRKEAEEWRKFQVALRNVERVKVKRCALNSKDVSFELHGFCDASKDAFGATVYLRSISPTGEAAMNLLCSKSRVAPLKTVSIPRLELCAAELLAKLTTKVINSLKMDFSRVCLWSDATIVLGWIKTNPHLLKTFVANRVSRIQETTKDFTWKHIRSEENPADLISRGLSAEKMTECSLWWNGPTVLQQESLSSVDIPYPSDEDFLKELKRSCELTMTVTIEPDILDTLLERSSNFLKLKRKLCFVFRFIDNSRNPLCKTLGPLEPWELDRAQKHIIKFVQVREFKSEINCLSKGKNIPVNSKLKGLNPYLDENSVLRVGGRLVNADLHFDQVHPIVIPKDNKVTKLIFEYCHKRNFHAGPQALLYTVREQFWPIGGRDLARKVVRDCIICFKNSPKVSTQIMGNLPPERVNPTSPFNVAGVDFAGPFHIKPSANRRVSLIKVYLAVFICFVTKAMHLEVVSDLSSAAFIACLRRFFARRGKSAKLFSDNATNFVGAKTELKKLYELVKNPDEELGNYLSSEQVSWKFIPARSPNFGGLWECGVKTVKYYLRRNIANAKLTYEEFLTIVAQIEGIVNSRPISPLSSDPNDFRALTPGHFLIGRPLNAFPEPELLEIRENRLSRWQLTTKIVQTIWHRWQKDYLSNLQNRTKWFFQKDNVSRDDLVLIRDDNLPPYKWSLGRIEEIIKGADGKVRVAIVRTPTGTIKRGVNKLCLLPMNV